MSLWLLPIPDKASLFAPALFYWFSQPLPLLAKKFFFILTEGTATDTQLFFCKRRPQLKTISV